MLKREENFLIEVQYFAPIQYYSKLFAYDTVILEQYEHYSKGSFRNRCSIAMSNTVHSLSIPLSKGKNQQSDIRDVRLDYGQDWQKIHFRTIKTAYGSAPYYEYYEPYLLPFFTKKSVFLFDFCLEIQETICRLLKLNQNIAFSQAYITDYKGTDILDFRNKINPKTFADASVWDENFNLAAYPQIFEDRNGFIPNLSILDLLFCAGPEALLVLYKSTK